MLLPEQANELHSLLCFIILQLTLVFFLLLLKPYKKLIFNHDCIQKEYGKPFARKKIIEYQQVKGIVICAATDSKFYRLKDKQGKQVALLSLFDSECSFVSSLHPKIHQILNSPNMFDCLGNTVLNTDDLNLLLTHTSPNTHLYITEEILLQQENVLNDVLEEHADNIYIACYDTNGKNRIMPYALYKK